MANPNNLIRPPVINPVPAGISQEQFNQLQTNLLGSLRQLFLTEGRTLISNVINPTQEFANLPDQIIDERYNNNLEDLEKVPDIIKSLREFSGKHTEFSSWRKSIEEC
ncbi:Retrovirus-related Gag polyprotein from transposon HMS-Beagle [Eumeta japonica]|uniref:Retrovirus-related Gag polyprotein from transposon HMS-Beagle n=1 Tax=Eumeta variegata TaxID=151549 RepID=A0A4C1SFJ5_EUMVA|nr:Retrovirus-related Gag polyprotein from transposon HMS-Beagle [Eumeta japonica]